MKRFWILFLTEWKTWRHDPITALGGLIPTTILFIIFGVLFGGNLGFKLAIVNQDQGPYGQVLLDTARTALSPLGNMPYYRVYEMEESEALSAYEAYRLEGVWIIPPDFSTRIETGTDPKFEMIFSNYNDDRAKNHRIYSAEILWKFYHQLGCPQPPFEIAEQYPRDQMVEWFPIIGVGIILLGATLGGMFNIFMLTHKERKSGLLVEMGLAPFSLLRLLLAKVLLALILAVVTGTILMGVLYLWIGSWLLVNLLAVWLLMALVSIFWIVLAMWMGLLFREYMSGAITAILSGIIIFFVGGGLSLVRGRESEVVWLVWLFPNIYALDPLRDLLLFSAFPLDWNQTVLILSAFAFGSLLIGGWLIIRKIRHS